MNQTEEMSDTLLEVGIFLLSRERREQLAEQLQSEGITCADVVALHSYLEVCCSDEVGKSQRVLATYLQDEKNRLAIVKDVRKRNNKISSRIGMPSDGGASIRQQNMQAIKRFEDEYNKYLADKAAGLLPPVERREMPWDR